MADLIDRQELLKRLNTKWEDAVTAIKKSPAIEAEPVKHGWWELVVYKPIGHDYICSLCNFAACNEHSYCPNCGAKMDLEG